MFRLMKQNNNIAVYVTEFVADEEADIADLPTDDSVYPGSVCIVTATSNVYMLNNKKEWKKL